MVLRPVSDLRVVTRDGAALFGIDANCHEPLSQGGLPLRAIWHNEDITEAETGTQLESITRCVPVSSPGETNVSVTEKRLSCRHCSKETG